MNALKEVGTLLSESMFRNDTDLTVGAASALACIVRAMEKHGTPRATVIEELEKAQKFSKDVEKTNPLQTTVVTALLRLLKSPA